TAMTDHGTEGGAMVENALACGKCGAGLPPPNIWGASVCVYCGTEYRDRTSEVLAAAVPRSTSSLAVADIPADRPSRHDGEEAARLPMTGEAVLHLLRQHLAGAESVFVCPHVPPKKEDAARRAHVVHLPARERILALYDASWFGRDDHATMGPSF